MSMNKIKEMHPKGIIFTGEPNSVYGKNSPHCPKKLLELGVPILGICYGSQLMAHLFGGSVTAASVSEYGRTEFTVDTSSVLFQGVNAVTICWMSHTDYIENTPAVFKITAHNPILPGCHNGMCGKETVRGAVPSGSAAHARRRKDDFQLCASDMRLLRRLEDGFVR